MGIVDPNSVTNTQAELNAIPEAKIPVSNPVMEGFTEGVGHATEIAGNIAPWLVPGGALVEAPLIAGARMYDAAQNQENSVPGAVGLGALEGIAMAAVPAAAGRLLAPVRQGLGGLAGGIAEGGAVGATLPAVSAGVSQMSGDPERAQQELGGIGTSAGVGGLLGAMLSRGKVAPGTGPRQPMTDQGSRQFDLDPIQGGPPPGGSPFAPELSPGMFGEAAPGSSPFAGEFRTTPRPDITPEMRSSTVSADPVLTGPDGARRCRTRCPESSSRRALAARWVLTGCPLDSLGSSSLLRARRQ